MQAYAVIIPAYNVAAFIGEAVASVRAQTVPPAEIIVVDDGSTDGTADAARALGDDIVVLMQANQGCGGATTTGFRAARSPVLAPLDADDRWLPEKMEAQLNCLASEPALAGVFSHFRTFRDTASRDEGQLGEATKGWNRSTMAIRREVFETTGAIIDPPGGCGDMVDWLARVREGGHSLHMMDDVLMHRRIRPGSLTYAQSMERDGGYLFAARQAIMRRRARQD